ncbi:MAG: TlpA disulfide reductase family protein [Verrucomicrobiota bacterium]
MKPRAAFVLLFISIQGLQSLFGDLPAPGAQLRWNSGETISGEIAGASPSELTWKSPFFDEPLALNWNAFTRIDQPIAPERSPDPFSFACRDGSHFYGTITSITGDFIHIHSTRHGDTQIARTQLLSIRRIQTRAQSGSSNDPLSVTGLHGDVQWVPAQSPEMGRRQNQGFPVNAFQNEPIIAGPGGSLQIPYWNQSIVRNIELPPRLELEFQIHTVERPDFELSLTGKGNLHFSIETWDTELVAHTAGSFKHILTLPVSERIITLRLFWDQPAQTCTVYGPSGQKLAELFIGKDQSKTPHGILLKNKGRSLNLDFLRLREWNGAAPLPIALHKPYLELADGRLLNSKIHSLQNNQLTLEASDSNPETEISLDAVDAIIFSRDAVQPDPAAITLSYSDGTFLCGKITSINHDKIELQTNFAQSLFTSNLAGLRQLKNGLGKPSPALGDETDRLDILGKVFHGQLVFDGSVSPRWLPEGGVKPTTPARGSAAKITRAFEEKATIPTPEALVYTANGDVLPGSIGEIQNTSVTLHTDLFQKHQLPATMINGIQMSPRPQVHIEGFTEGWQILKGDETSVVRNGPDLRMEPDTALYHPDAMSCSVLRFEIPPSSFAVTAFRFFSDGTSTPCPTLLILRTDDQLVLKTENVTGGVGSQTSAKISGEQAVEAKFLLKDRVIEIWLNGVAQQSIKLDGKNLYNGLLIEPGSLWGNRIQPMALAKFSGKSQPGKLALSAVQPEAKQQALTVPRFRRDNPPQHVLLAPNGDVLRGELESASKKHVQFRSGNEVLTIPRDRIQAAIWLKKQSATSQSSDAMQTTLKKLDRNLADGPWGGDLQSHIYHLKETDPSLRYKVSGQTSTPHASLIFEGTSLAKAIEAIATVFGLQSRIDLDGSIVLEQRATASPIPLQQQSYWLNEQPFPPGSDLKAFLSEFGITFPNDAQIAWEPGSKQLLFTNTPENHLRLRSVLNKNFGGILGSPTHWVVLNNGARFGLNVAAFGPDYIKGQHPVYGHCSIPVTQVFEIANFVQPPPGAWKSLENWELIPAPEPVIPESGGENSQLLGKPAKLFQLPRLDGSPFDLEVDRGKVIILDFWATWCGPCVKAMPELMETLSFFPKDQIHLVGVNEGEAPEGVQQFLKQRGWNLDVVLDASQEVGKQFGLEGIPHTVIIGPDGKIEWIKTGYSADNAKEAAEIVQKLLGKTPATPKR